MPAVERSILRMGLVEIVAFVKAKIGSVKAPKQVDVWPDLPRSKIGKVLKREIRAQLLRK
jgi:fatty-acyl-CoA synthase